MDHSRFTRALAVVALMAATFVTPQLAHAGGYDTPMLYSARHQAMGGTAVSYVDDPAALFHNPAGLAGIERGEILVNATILLGGITASPRADQLSIDSELTFAPFPLLGGAARVLDMDWGGLVIGAGVFPIASAAGTYKYCEGNRENADGSCETEYTDQTTLLFIEVTPAIALNINLGDVGELRIGGGWRATWVSLARVRGNEDLGYIRDPNGIDFNATGWNFEGFRVGLQALFLDNRLSFGFNYRHRVSANIEATAPQDVTMLGGEDPADGTPIVLGGPENFIRTTFNLPSRMVFGARYDHPFGPVTMGYAVDIEYGFNSQNGQENLFAGPNAEVFFPDGLANVFAWSDAITARIGLEAMIHDVGGGDIAARLGYTYDQKTANELYASAFGTPPGATHVASLGAGYDAGPWELNFGYAFRTGSATVVVPDGYSNLSDARTSGDESIGSIGSDCAFCSFTGDASITLHGIYLDFSYTWEREVEAPADDEEEEPQPEWEQTPDGEPSEEPEPTATEPTATEPTATEPTETEPTATEPTPEQQLEAEPGQDAPAAETTAADGTEEPLPAD